MADSQVPWGVEALNGAVTEPAWRSKPSWYLVATDDRMIPPPAQRAMSERAGATVVEARRQPLDLRLAAARDRRPDQARCAASPRRDPGDGVMSARTATIRRGAVDRRRVPSLSPSPSAWRSRDRLVSAHADRAGEADDRARARRLGRLLRLEQPDRGAAAARLSRDRAGEPAPRAGIRRGLRPQRPDDHRRADRARRPLLRWRRDHERRRRRSAGQGARLHRRLRARQGRIARRSS